MGMNRLLARLVVLCCIAAACGTSTNTADPAASEAPATTATAPATTLTAPAASTTAAEPTVPAAIGPVTDRLLADPDAPAAEWVAGVNAAGWDFHRHLVGNAVSSPMSIGIAFSLSRVGASPDTAAVLDEIFGYPRQGNHSAANAVDLLLAKASAEPNTIEVANRLFPDDGFSPRPEFLQTAAGHYGATIQPVDTADGEAAAAVINDWVSGRTRGLIPMIVNQGTVQGQELILVNTVYLKADWDTPFLADFTRDGEFTTDAGERVTVPFMRDAEAVVRRYVLLANANAVELPYVGRDLAMWIIVPHEHDGLAAVEASLDAASLVELAQVARRGTVDLTMPKWEQTLPPANLFDWLCPRGLCPGAAFDGIAPGIFITSALHSAKVIVDEKGTEAAAATSMGFDMSEPPPPDLTVVADRPFLWAIVHNKTQALLFLGRLTDPTL